MTPFRMLVVIGGGIVGLAGTIYGWNWLTGARPEDFTAGLVALVFGAPIGTTAGVLLAGTVYDRLVPPTRKE